MKSSISVRARRPAKLRMGIAEVHRRHGARRRLPHEGEGRRPWCRGRPFRRPRRSDPQLRLPCTVGETSTPLPTLLGHWKITWCTRSPELCRAGNIRRGSAITVKACGFAMSFTRSLHTPAAFTTKRVSVTRPPAVTAEAALRLFNRRDLAVELHARAVFHGRLRQRDGQLPRAHDAGRGGQQGAGGLAAHVRLKLLQLRGGEHAQPRHAVFLAARAELAHKRVLLLVKGEHETADLLIRHVELFAQLLHEGVALDVVARHFRAGEGIVSRVHDGAVRFRRAHGDVVLLFEQHGCTS